MIGPRHASLARFAARLEIAGRFVTFHVYGLSGLEWSSCMIDIIPGSDELSELPMDDAVLSWKRRIREDAGFIFLLFLPLAVACAFAAVQRYHVFPNAPWWAPIFHLWPLILPPVLYFAKVRDSFTGVLAVLVPLELLCASVAEFTLIGLSGF